MESTQSEAWYPLSIGGTTQGGIIQQIPLRGATLSESSLWLQGPDWLCSTECLPDSVHDPVQTTIPGDCHHEMKRKDLTISFITMETCKPRLRHMIDPERYILFDRLFHVTELVLRFISCLRNRAGHVTSPPPSIDSPTQSDLDQARLSWAKDS